MSSIVYCCVHACSLLSPPYCFLAPYRPPTVSHETDSLCTTEWGPTHKNIAPYSATSGQKLNRVALIHLCVPCCGY